MSPPVLPRPEHPRPQFRRRDWLNLNGPWTCAFDFGLSGMEREWFRSPRFERTILVPFCPESTLSGVAYTDFIPALWYQRTLRIPRSWAGRRVLLRFGGVDYDCTVYVDGECVGQHVGGSSSFACDISAHVKAGNTHNLVVYARDDIRSGVQAAGKQSASYASHGCHYTRTTGIWQTVWLEAAGWYGLRDVHVIPDVAHGAFFLTPRWYAWRHGLRLRVRLSARRRMITEHTVPAQEGVPMMLKVPEPHLWSPDDPFLYELTYTVLDEHNEVLDEVNSYAGLRSFGCDGDQLRLNGQPIYLRMVLDQGFYPDGIWTAPSDAALKRDILLAQRAGFNGARLHQKVFEERFHYWADRLGYLTWAESPNWGMDLTTPAAARNFLTEWGEVIVRDRNHPSIIAWTPFNETNPTMRSFNAQLQRDVYALTKALDPTRPINDASGWCHVITDLFTVHTYEQDPAKLAALLQPGNDGQVWQWAPAAQTPYAGQPYLVDEFGGIKWIPAGRQPHSPQSWGYGEAPRTLEEFYTRLEGLVNAILAQPHVRGYCYTQLTDVEQEQNGLYTYDRSAKFDLRRLARIFRRTPALQHPL